MRSYFRNHPKSRFVIRVGDLNNKVKDQHEQEFLIDAIYGHEAYDSMSHCFIIAYVV